jgi:hypothetical protein
VVVLDEVVAGWAVVVEAGVEAAFSSDLIGSLLHAANIDTIAAQRMIFFMVYSDIE